jgi:hypothetical protein
MKKQVPYYWLTPDMKLSYERDMYPCKSCPAPLECGKKKKCAQMVFFIAHK